MGKLATFFVLMFVCCSLLCIVVEGGGVAATRLDGDITATDTEITVVNMEGFLTNVDVDHLGTIVIKEEIIWYSGVTDTTFTGCTRGAYDRNTKVQGTEASIHADGTRVRTTNIAALDSFIGYNITSSTATSGIFESIKFVAGVGGGFFRHLPRMLVWDYPFFHGMLVYVRYILFALSAGFVFAIIMGMIGLVQGIMRVGG